MAICEICGAKAKGFLTVICESCISKRAESVSAQNKRMSSKLLPDPSPTVMTDSPEADESRLAKGTRWAKYILIFFALIGGVTFFISVVSGDGDLAAKGIIQVFITGPIFALIAFGIGWISGKDSPPPASSSDSASSSSQKIPINKTCHYCAEVIKYAAIKCRYCGSNLET